MALNIKEKKALLEVLEQTYDYVESLKKDTLREYRVIGKESEQAKSWKTDELLWEDEEHTIPKYYDKYGYVDKTDDELTESDKVKLTAINEVLKALEKMA